MGSLWDCLFFYIYINLCTMFSDKAWILPLKEWFCFLCSSVSGLGYSGYSLNVVSVRGSTVFCVTSNLIQKICMSYIWLKKFFFVIWSWHICSKCWAVILQVPCGQWLIELTRSAMLRADPDYDLFFPAKLVICVTFLALQVLSPNCS